MTSFLEWRDQDYMELRMVLGDMISIDDENRELKVEIVNYRVGKLRDQIELLIKEMNMEGDDIVAPFEVIEGVD